MARRTKASPERLYGSTVNWEGWTFQILSSVSGVRFIELAATPFDVLAERLSARVLPDDDPNEKALQQIHEYLRGERRTFDLPLDLRGTAFQVAVWNALRKIPYGETRSYGEVATAVGRPKATRAVGQANGANPIPIIIPCHRVIGTTGGLVGFGGGLPLKERLLVLEQGGLRL